MKRKEKKERKKRKRKKESLKKKIERKKGLLYRILNLPRPPRPVLVPPSRIQKGSLIFLKLGILKIHDK